MCLIFHSILFVIRIIFTYDIKMCIIKNNICLLKIIFSIFFSSKFYIFVKILLNLELKSTMSSLLSFFGQIYRVASKNYKKVKKIYNVRDASHPSIRSYVDKSSEVSTSTNMVTRLHAGRDCTSLVMLHFYIFIDYHISCFRRKKKLMIHNL